MKFNDLMDPTLFKFDPDEEGDEEEDVFENISYFEAVRRLEAQLANSEQLNARLNHIRPLKTLKLAHIKLVCINDEASGRKLSKCYEDFLPAIATQLKELPETYRLQEIAWPHLFKRRSTIIIHPSQYLADLVYLPVICTHVNVISL